MEQKTIEGKLIQLLKSEKGFIIRNIKFFEERPEKTAKFFYTNDYHNKLFLKQKYSQLLSFRRIYVIKMKLSIVVKYLDAIQKFLKMSPSQSLKLKNIEQRFKKTHLKKNYIIFKYFGCATFFLSDCIKTDMCWSEFVVP